MEKKDWNKIEKIIDEALRLPESKRYVYIAQQCKGDEALKSEVTLLLESIIASEGWLENPDDYRAALYDDIFEDPAFPEEASVIGQRIGAYRITEELGRGGMGTVFLAKRSDGIFEHQVAIKIIRESQATRENIRRFEQERNILASLNHPGIAKLFDGGITENGSPYLIMEYIDGIPIDQYCSQHKVSLNGRIGLFKQVLEAVRHAHQNMVIHRDLKPGNILVTPDGQVKILDFGISKLLEDSSEPASLTQTRGRLLTPKYAAPEQIKQQPITTATDLYALGLIFYQLLCGHLPFDHEQLSQYELEQHIINEHSAPPSQKNPGSAGINAKLLRGDLDAIALKAVRKEPDRRYQVANEFLEDLNNYEQELPVMARKKSWRYRSLKFVKRHQLSLGVLTIILLLSLSFAVFYTKHITEERNKAQLEATRAEQVTDFMISLFRNHNPRQSLGKKITVSEAMTRAYEKLQTQTLSSANKATILGMIGEIQSNLGEIKKSGNALKKAMPMVLDSVQKQTPKTIDVISSYASWNINSGNMKKGEQYFLMADSLFKATNLTGSDSYIVNKLNLADFYNQNGSYRKALDILDTIEKKISTITEDHILYLSYFYNNRGIAYAGLGDYKPAFDNYEHSLQLKQKIYGQDNPELGLSYHNIASLYLHENHYKRAYQLYKKAYTIRKKAYGPDHPLVASTLSGLGLCAQKLKKFEESQRYFLKSNRILKEKNGAHYYRYALGLRNYAGLLTDMGKYQQAEKTLFKANKIIGTSLGYNHLYSGYIDNSLAKLYRKRGESDKALDYYNKSITIFRKSQGSKSPMLAELLEQKGSLALIQRHIQQAIELLNKSVAIYQSRSDTTSYLYGKSLYYLGKGYYDNDQKEKAMPVLIKARSIISEKKGEKFRFTHKADSLLESLNFTTN